MRTYTHKQKRTRKAKSPSSTRPSQTVAGQSSAPSFVLHLQREIGNQAVQRLIQARAEKSAGSAASSRIVSVASAGISKAGTKLPHLDKIQSSFGRFGITDVQAHSAPGANERLGSKAYTLGNHVAFAQNPSLYTAAHEAAHVVQQRAGVQLWGGVGRAGDPYERHADQVAHEVVAGRSAEGILDKMSGGGDRSAGVQNQAVQFWSPPAKPDHKDFTNDAVDRWNGSHPKGTKEHIPAHLKTWMAKCSDDPDHTGRALTGTPSDLRIYFDFAVGGKKRRHKEYAAADPAKKKKLYAAAMKSFCASEGPSHGEGNRPNYGSGGSAVNIAHTTGQIQWASRLTFGGFMSRAGAGQLGDAMHCAQDRGSHCEGNRYEGHDDIKDKLGIDNYNTDDPSKNTLGKAAAEKNSDKVLADFAKLRS